MTAHLPGHYVGGSPQMVTLINDEGVEHQDWLWYDMDASSELEMIGVTASAMANYGVQAYMAGQAMIKSIQVYDDAWSRRFVPKQNGSGE